MSSGSEWLAPKPVAGASLGRLEQDFLGGVVVAAVVGLSVLVSGHLSALIFEGGWPRYPASAIPGVLWRFVEDPSDPEAAWEPVNRGADVAGPVVWWLTWTVLVAGVGFIVAVANRHAIGGRSGGGRWAGWREVRRLRVWGPSDRLVVGTTGFRRRLAVEARHSLLVFGPTQSGKTTGLAIPAILEWPGPLVATSTKGDLVADTAGWRSRLGRVQVFDPAHATELRGSCWSPLASCGSWRGATQMAWELAMAGKASGDSGMLAGFWYGSAAKSLAPYLYAAARSGRDIGDVARWVDREERDEVLQRLLLLHPDAALAHEATFRREDRARSSLFQVMQQVLAPYLDPSVAASAARREIAVDDLLDGGAHTLYVTAPHHDQARFRPLFATLVSQVFTAVYSRAAQTGAPLSPPLLVVLDEAANIAPVEDLPAIASTAAAMGLQLVTVFQDLAQIKNRYGQVAGTVVNNHRAKLLLPGVSDLDTLDLVGRLAGETEVDRASLTTDLDGRRSTTTSTSWRRLLAPESARQLPDGRGVLLYGNLPPVRVRLRPWYQHRALSRRACLAADQHPAALEADDTDAGRAETITALDAARARLRLVPPIEPGGET